MTRTITIHNRVVLVCGGRDFRDYAFACRTLDQIHAESPIGLIVHGAASGADTLGRWWAESRLGPEGHWPFPAEWRDVKRPGAVVRRRRDGSLFDVTAGHFRNQRMLDEANPCLVVAFPGGSGTRDMVRRARKAGVPVVEVAP